MVATLAAILAGLLAGIGLVHGMRTISDGFPFDALPLPAALGFLALLLLGLARNHLPPLLRFAALAAAVLPLAMGWSLWRTLQPDAQDPSHWAPLRHAQVLGTVASDPRLTERGWRFEIVATGLQRPVPRAGHGKLLVRGEPDLLSQANPSPGEHGHGGLRYGQRIVVHGSLKLPPAAQNPGEFDYREFLARNGIFAVMNARSLTILPEEPPPSLVGGAIAFKNDALALLARHLPSKEAALLGSLLFGDGASPIDPETAEAFRALGLAHVLAVSGAQILFLWGMLQSLITALGLPKGAGIALGCASLWGYALMTGLPPSVVRATWMGCALILGWAVERPWLRYLSLEAVVIGMLFYRPSLLFDVGFQFSVIATFALLHTAPRLLPSFRKLPLPLAQAAAMALAAGLWVLPLQVFHFGQFSPYSLFLNMLTCFMVEAVTVLGFVAVIGGAVSELLGHQLLGGAYLLLKAFTGLVEATLQLPEAAWYLRIPPAWWLASAYVLLVAGLLKRVRWSLILLPILLYVAWERLDRPRNLEIVALSVGQGDALVIRTPEWRWYLIDGGPRWPGGEAGSRTVLPYLRRQGCRRLDGVILSHAHDDHAGGLAAIAEGLPVAAVWDAGEAANSPGYQRWLEAVLSKAIPLITVEDGMRVDLEPGLSLEILGPPRKRHRGTRSDANNNSIVLMLQYREFRMLFAGDLEEEAEVRLLQRPERLRAAVLKVAHHGSRFGSGRAFLQAVAPAATIVSVGANNTFRHPARETLARLRPHGRIYRTDQDGAIMLRTDGVRWSLSTGRVP